jgi:thiamine transport system substrate-binding protein
MVAVASKRRASAAVVATAAVMLSACSVGGTSDEGDGSAKQVVVATHDSWAMSKDVLI